MTDLEQLKKDMVEVKDSMRDVKDALLGTDFNQHNGMVADVEKIKEDVKKLQSFENELSIYIKQVKMFIGVLLAVITGLLIKSEY